MHKPTRESHKTGQVDCVQHKDTQKEAHCLFKAYPQAHNSDMVTHTNSTGRQLRHTYRSTGTHDMTTNILDTRTPGRGSVGMRLWEAGRGEVDQMTQEASLGEEAEEGRRVGGQASSAYGSH